MTIETVFFELTTTLTCEVDTLGYPKAALQSNYGEQKVKEDVSAYYLTLEISQTYDGMMIAIPTQHWHIFRELSVKEFAEFLKTIFANVKLKKYKKHR